MAHTTETERSKGQPVSLPGTLEAGRRMPFEHPHPWYAAQMKDNRWLRYRAIQDGMERPEDLKKYLPQFPYELDNLYEHRIRNSYFLGGSNTAVERLVGAVFAAEPNFRSEAESVVSWVDDIDGEGTSLRDWVEELSGEANWMGAAFAVITKPAAPDGVEVLTEMDEMILDLRRPVVESLKVEDVPAWGFDDRGGIAWVAVRQTVARQESPTAARLLVERWRVFDRVAINVYERPIDPDTGAADEDEVLTHRGMIEHGLGVLPVVPIYGRFRQKMQGESFIKGASRADVAKLLEDSWGSQIRNTHANPILALSSDRDVSSIYIGGNVVRLEPDEEMKYIPQPSLPFDARDKAAEKFTHEAIAQTGSNPSFTSSGTTRRGESGVAQQTRFSQTEKRHILAHTRRLEMAATRLMDLAEMILEDRTMRELGANHAQFFNTFEVFELEGLARVYNSIAPSIDSDTFHAEMQTNLSMRLVADAPQDVRAKIRDEIAASPSIEADDL